MFLPKGLHIYADCNDNKMFYTEILIGASMNFNRIFYREHYIFLECHKLEISPGYLKHEILIIAAS